MPWSTMPTRAAANAGLPFSRPDETHLCARTLIASVFLTNVAGWVACTFCFWSSEQDERPMDSDVCLALHINICARQS